MNILHNIFSVAEKVVKTVRDIFVDNEPRQPMYYRPDTEEEWPTFMDLTPSQQRQRQPKPTVIVSPFGRDPLNYLEERARVIASFQDLRLQEQKQKQKQKPQPQPQQQHQYQQKQQDQPTITWVPKSKEVLPLKTIHKLSNYPPRDCVRDSQMGYLTDSSLDTRYLSAGNIHNIFQSLLELEDVATLQEYVPLIQRNVTLKKDSNDRYCAPYNSSTPGNIQDILTPNLDLVVVVPTEKSALLNRKFDVASIQMFLSQMDVYEKSTAVIKDVGRSSVSFEFDKPTNLKESKIKYDLIFFSMRIPIRYQYRALELLANDWQMREYLFPNYNFQRETSYPISNSKLINPEIAENPEQLQAVSEISSGPNPYAPYVIFGPPGTGKTTTIVECILQLRLQRPRSRILVTAGSNSACDTIALRICQCYESSPRLQQHLRETNILPIIRIFSKSIQKRGAETIRDELKKCSNIAWKDGSHAYPAVGDIHKYGIVVVTLCTVGKLVCADVSVSNHFTHIFIDEAAASTEPETLVGIMGIKSRSKENCRVILSGDNKQLGPVLKSDYAIKLGLNISLMQRLLNNECYALGENGNYDQTLQTRLRRNYRSHREIVNLFNTLYYNNELLAMNTKYDTKCQRKWSFLKNSLYPIVFKAVDGVTTKQNTTSSCNMREIDVVMWYVNLLIKRDCAKQADIGIISPYKLQCKHIQKRLEDQQCEDIEVGSVENFQGREKEIIIVSMVRSSRSLGFLNCPRRLNVTFSRAKSLLIVVGNPVTLCQIEDVVFLIENCMKNGTFFEQPKKNNFEKHSNKSRKVHPIKTSKR